MDSTSISVYWCHACNGFLRLLARDPMICPICGGGFIEEMSDAVSIFQVTNPLEEENIMTAPPNHHGNYEGFDHGVYDRLFRRDTTVQNGATEFSGGNASGTELEPLPAYREDYFLGSGLEQLIQQLSENDRCGPPPAPRASANAMPTIKINSRHLTNNSHCPVCQERFDVGGEAREMPCKHIYHSDCILPWLAQHNSCPICRHGLPSEVGGSAEAGSSSYRPNNETLCPPASSAAGGRAIVRGSQNAPAFSIRVDPTGQILPVYVGVGRTTNANNNNNSETIDNNAARRIPNGGENERRFNLLSYLWPFGLSSANHRRRREWNANVSRSNDSNANDQYRWRPGLLYGAKIYFTISFCIYILTRLLFYEAI